MVVHKFCVRDHFKLQGGVCVTEDVEICCNLLISMFCFPIRLGIVGCREEKVVFKGFSKFLGEGRGELRTPIRDGFVIETESGVDFVEKERGDTGGGDSFLSGA